MQCCLSSSPQDVLRGLGGPGWDRHVQPGSVSAEAPLSEAMCRLIPAMELLPSATNYIFFFFKGVIFNLYWLNSNQNWDQFCQ